MERGRGRGGGRESFFLHCSFSTVGNEKEPRDSTEHMVVTWHVQVARHFATFSDSVGSQRKTPLRIGFRTPCRKWYCPRLSWALLKEGREIWARANSQHLFPPLCRRRRRHITRKPGVPKALILAPLRSLHLNRAPSAPWPSQNSSLGEGERGGGPLCGLVPPRLLTQSHVWRCLGSFLDGPTG